jgi:hypothetical protein
VTSLRLLRGLAAIVLCMLGAAGSVRAEPYLAVQQGYKCIACHVHPTGGGLRNEFGNIFAQNVLPAHTIEVADSSWTGSVSRFFMLGGDVRADWTWTDVPHQAQSNEFDVTDARVYLNVEPIPGRLSIYLDQDFASGSGTNLETYVRYWSKDRAWFVRAGRMYLPFGLRLEDDSAFTRTVPGINMTTPDTGVEVGWESTNWSAQLALSNGSAGGEETDDGKQVTGQLVYVDPRWRLGLASSFNDSDAGDRVAYGLFGGLKTGPVAWLAEADLVVDDGFPDGSRDLVSALLEADWAVRRGHNLKLSAEWFDPDRDVDNDEQTRWSAVYEYAPIQFLQLRGGARFYDGIPQNDLQNRTIGFIELHGFF